MNQNQPDVSLAIDTFKEKLFYLSNQQNIIPQIDRDSISPIYTRLVYETVGVIENQLTKGRDYLTDTEVLFDCSVWMNKSDFINLDNGERIIPNINDTIISPDNIYWYSISDIREISNYYKFLCKRIVGGDLSQLTIISNTNSVINKQPSDSPYSKLSQQLKKLRGKK